MDQTFPVRKNLIQKAWIRFHISFIQLLCQGEAHLALETALLATAEAFPSHGNSLLDSLVPSQEHKVAETRSTLVFSCLQGTHMTWLCFCCHLSAKCGSVIGKCCCSLLSGQKSNSAPTHRYIFIF